MLRTPVAAALLALATVASASEDPINPPEDSEWTKHGAYYKLGGPLCLPPGGTTQTGRKPIKLLMPPTTREMTYVRRSQQP